VTDTKITLPESEIPTHFYNIAPDLPPPPPLHPATREPIGPEALAPIFPFGGLVFPFLRDKLSGARKGLRAIAAEPASCPSLTRGAREYDFGDTAGLTPLMMMHTLGHTFMPAPVHAGGLRYHGSAPLVSHLLASGVIEAEAYNQREVFDSAMKFARSEGTIPAPESAHAIHSAVRHALEARESGEAKVILFNLSGHGLFDLGAYESYLAGEMAS
jgi:tryptophan synthase beta chain